jgi:hypothetical protein
MIAEELKTYNKAQATAMANGSYAPESASGMQLIEKISSATMAYNKLMAPFQGGAKKVVDPAIAEGAADLAGKAAPPAAKGNLAQTNQLAPVVAPAAAEPPPQRAQAPARSTDGGQTWFLDIPAVIRDPSVPFYRNIPNPKLALGKQSFKSRGEAEAAFLQTAQ